MPGRDGTGPMGAGQVTGRGLGLCSGANAGKFGAGSGMGLGLRLGCRCSFRGSAKSGVAVYQASGKTRQEWLRESRAALKSRLAEVDRELENL
jgi:hypothetical protein